MTWVKYYYVLQRGTLYVYEKDVYDKPFEILDLDRCKIEERPSVDGKKFIIGIIKNGQESQPYMQAACESQETYNNWIQALKANKNK